MKVSIFGGMLAMCHMVQSFTEMMLIPLAVPLSSGMMSVHFLQVVHTLLSNMEHEGQLPRRLVAALQSMFTTAAGSRQEVSQEFDIISFCWKYILVLTCSTFAGSLSCFAT